MLATQIVKKSLAARSDGMSSDLGGQTETRVRQRPWQRERGRSVAELGERELGV